MHPFNEREIIFQIGDDARYMRESCEFRKRGSALKVGKNEVDRVCIMGYGKAGHNSAQQFAFTRTGCSNNQPMWPLPSLSAFLQIQEEGFAIRSRADRNIQ